MSDQKKSLIVDQNKAIELGESIHYQYTNRLGLFEKYEPPDYSLPKGMISGSKGHSLFLTYVFALDDMNNSHSIWKKSRQIYEESPWFFDAEQILTRSDRGIFDTLTKLNVSEPNENMNRWRTISKNLLYSYAGDPRKLTEKPLELSKAIKKVKKLFEIDDDRIIHRYIQLISTNKLIKIKKSTDLGIFVNRNIVLFTIYTGVIKIQDDSFEGYLDSDPLSTLTRKIWNKVVKSLNIKPWYLENPINIIGEKLCPEMKCLLCPIYSNCDKKFNMEITKNKIKIGISKIEKIIKSIYCIYCGRNLEKNAKYCDYCGKKVAQ
jgi:hypothetical protein